ncbi:hypothetical protein D3C74_152310 [compost metagenome]
MTREEILAMKPGEALDTLILDEILKWEKREMWWGETRWVRDKKTNDGKEVHVDIELFSASTDISAAWEVLELPEIMDKVQLGVYPTSFGKWIARPFMPGGYDCTVQAETAPEAICKAALLVYWSDKNAC